MCISVPLRVRVTARNKNLKNKQYKKNVRVHVYFCTAACSCACVCMCVRMMGTPRLAMRMGAVLEDEACHDDISIGIGRRVY